MIEIAGLIIASIGAMGTLVQAYYSAASSNRSVNKSKIKQAEERAQKPLKIGQKKVAEVIDPDLLKKLQIEIQAQTKQLISALRSNDISAEERLKEVEAAKKEICRFLKQVLYFNDGVLPTKRLQNLWESNRCKFE